MKRGIACLGLALLLEAAVAQNVPPASRNSQTSAASSEASADRIYSLKDGVTPPHTIYSPNPKYPEGARKAHYQGVVVLWVVVDRDGLPRDIIVARSLRPDLDKAAVDAVKKWKFAPATKDGQPVAVRVNVEVSFRLN